VIERRAASLEIDDVMTSVAAVTKPSASQSKHSGNLARCARLNRFHTALS